MGLVSGPSVGTAHTVVLPCSYVFLPPLSTPAGAGVFSFLRTLTVLFIYSIDTESASIVWI